MSPQTSHPPWAALPLSQQLAITAILATSAIVFAYNLPPAVYETSAPVIFVLATVVSEAASFAARRSPALTEEWSGLGMGLAWWLGAAVSVKTKAAALRLLPWPELWAPLTDCFVIVELTAHLGAALGYLLAQVRGWNARTTSRVLALLTCMSVAALEVGYLLGTRQLHNIPAWAIGTYLTCTALAGYATWGIDRGFKVAEQRG